MTDTKLDEWADLEEGEVQLTRPDLVLYRNVNPKLFTEDGVPTFQVFMPTTNDNGKLSLYNGDKASCEDAVAQHQAFGRACIGAFALTVEELESRQLRVVDDSALGDGRPEAHAYADYRRMGKPERRTVAQLLFAQAVERDYACLAS